MEWTHGEYTLSDQRSAADLDRITALLQDTYWAATRTREQIAVTLENSICFSLHHWDVQVGLARVLSDYAATSYLCDVVIHPDHRSRKLGTWLLETILEQPCVRNTNVLLITRDAEDFYSRLGFSGHPYKTMVKRLRA